MEVAAIILAAGKGTRMRSALPKVLHPLAGRPLLAHVLDTARALKPTELCVVYGHGGDLVKASLEADDVQWAEQANQQGTGHAVAQGLPFTEAPVVLVLYGDVPLIREQTLRAVIAATSETSVGLLTLEMDDPTGYGRIIRNDRGEVRRIVEQKDAGASELAINEINTGILALPRRFLADALPRLSNDNAQGEYYLTDIIAMAVADGLSVTTVRPEHSWEVDGVNNRAQLGALERIYQAQIAHQLMAAGATLADAGRIDVRGKLTVGRDVFIDVGCVFEGDVEIADDVAIGPYCVIHNAAIGPGVTIESHSVIDGAAIAAGATVGPFARLRPGTELHEGAKVGNFVEVKKATVGRGSKVNHLSYIGDTEIGREANIGAGTITCNYDGANKYRTEIGDGAFIGSNSALVAPVTVGRGATVAAGSTITSDVGDEQLAVARTRQRNIDGWLRPRKK